MIHHAIRNEINPSNTPINKVAKIVLLIANTPKIIILVRGVSSLIGSLKKLKWSLTASYYRVFNPRCRLYSYQRSIFLAIYQFFH